MKIDGFIALWPDGGTGAPKKNTSKTTGYIWILRPRRNWRGPAKSRFPKMELRAPSRIIDLTRGPKHMLVERGLRVMNVEVVGEAYAIASNYLRRRGAIPDTFATDERLLEIIVQMFQRGEFNKIRLANKAIAKFEAETFIA
jgi:hypothetical protein